MCSAPQKRNNSKKKKHSPNDRTTSLVFKNHFRRARKSNERMAMNILVRMLTFLTPPHPKFIDDHPSLRKGRRTVKKLDRAKSR